ncbi:MAG: hypothetical protein IJU84_10155 [Clostridia bacterium]|nr:hypothetical protein [Clostridia bacterium]
MVFDNSSDLLLRLFHNLKNYDEYVKVFSGSDLDPLSRDALLDRIEIILTLKSYELDMLFYLRNSRQGEGQRFARLAKLNYDAFISTLELQKPLTD